MVVSTDDTQPPTGNSIRSSGEQSYKVAAKRGRQRHIFDLSTVWVRDAVIPIPGNSNSNFKFFSSWETQVESPRPTYTSYIMKFIFYFWLLNIRRDLNSSLSAISSSARYTQQFCIRSLRWTYKMLEKSCSVYWWFETMIKVTGIQRNTKKLFWCNIIRMNTVKESCQIFFLE